LTLELRNRIYDFVVEGSSSETIRLRSPTARRSKGREPADWDELVRQGMGSTQVCRKLRTEFYPMFRKHHPPVLVDFPDMVQYFRDCIMLDGLQASTAYAHVEISTTCMPPPTVDMRDVVLFISGAPGVTIEIECMDEQDFKIDSNSAWWDYLSRRVSKLLYSTDDPGCRCCQRLVNFPTVYVKPEYAEDWMYMADDDDEDGVYDVALLAWEVKLGIRGQHGAQHEVRVDKA
jgi:hypothetical protein